MARSRSVLKAVAVFAAGAIVVGLAAVAWIKLAPRRVPEGQPPLARLTVDSLSDFRKTFNDYDGYVRVIVMLSPT